MFSDATLTITSAKNNPVVQARFEDVYPVALSGLAYNQQQGDITLFDCKRDILIQDLHVTHIINRLG